MQECQRIADELSANLRGIQAGGAEPRGNHAWKVVVARPPKAGRMEFLPAS